MMLFAVCAFAEEAPAPIRIGPSGGTFSSLDALESALGLSLPDALAPDTGPWPDLLRYDLFVKSPIRPADGLPAATLQIHSDAPGFTFTALPPDGSIRYRRSPATGFAPPPSPSP